MRFTRTTIIVLALFAPLSIGVAAAAAQQTESRIIGTVADASAAVLPGVTVTVTSSSTGAVRTVVSEGDGSYTVTNLGPGGYVVRFTLDEVKSFQMPKSQPAV